MIKATHCPEPGPGKLHPSHRNEDLESYTELLREKYRPKKSILLIQVPQLQFHSFDRSIAKDRCYYAYPPTGLQWIAKSLENRDVQVDILDLNYELLKRVSEDESFEVKDWLKLLDEYLEKHDPSIVGVTCINVSKLFEGDNPFTQLLEHLKKKERHIVMSGGASALNHYSDLLKMGLCHFIFDGEGEHQINFLLDALFREDNGYPPSCKILFHHNGKVTKSRGEDSFFQFKGNLISTYKYIPIEKYHEVGVLNHFSRISGLDKPFAPIQLGRGCRANCMFCGVTKFMGRDVRACPPNDLLDEITYLVEQKGVRHFEWLDDDLLGEADALKEVLKGMAELRKKYGITWYANNGLIAAFITDELLKLMVDSGSLGFKIGVESGNADMLKRIRKPATLGKVRRACELINRYPSLMAQGNYIIGFFAEETFGQMLDSYRLACETRLDWTSFSVFQFTSTPAIVQDKLKKKDLGDTAVIPARDRPDGRLTTENVVMGPEVFNLPKDLVPSPDQVRQIWLAFNLSCNYFANKNLRPGGNHAKFTTWTSTLEVTYPYNAYIPLFTALGYVLQGNMASADRHLERARTNLGKDNYWREIAERFELAPLYKDFPREPQKVYDVLEKLSSRYRPWTGDM